MAIFLLRYCTNTHMLHSYRDSITGQLQHFSERVLHIDARLRRNKSKVLTEMTSCEHQYIENMNLSYLHNMKFT